MALKRENGNVRGDDDDHREQGGTADFDRCVQDRVEAGLGVRDTCVFQFRQLAHDVFHHDHRAIDDDAEVHRAQRQEVCRNANQGQAEKGRQQGQRNNGSHDQRGAQVPQKQKQDQRDQHRALDQIGEDRCQRFVD